MNVQPLLRFWNRLTAEEQQQLVVQIDAINSKLLLQQQQLLQHPPSTSSHFEPFLDFAYAGSKDDYKLGLEYIHSGKVACLILAGGQGTRLGFQGPKGLFPISVIQKKSLFQLFAEKTLAASQLVHLPLNIAIMTAPHNVQETTDFFKQHANFGLKEDQIHFFVQNTLPFLDKNGELFLSTPHTIATGPDGNGYALKELIHTGIAQQWRQQGVEYVNVILIDNPLADPFDAELIGFHVRQQATITMKCTERMNSEEKVGVVVRQQGHCQVIEYTELPKAEKEAVLSDGKLKHRCANLSLFCFNLSFIEKQSFQLPLHASWKIAQYVDDQGHIQHPLTPNAWKFEAFIFDVFPFAAKTAVLLYPRSICFAPLKNAQGDNSPITVKAALQERDRTLLQQLTQQTPPLEPFELAQDFYYPSLELKEKWLGRQATGGYILP